MLESPPLILRRPYLDFRARLEARGLRPSGESVFILLLAAIFAAAASMTFLAVVILGAPGPQTAQSVPSAVRLHVAARASARALPPP